MYRFISKYVCTWYLSLKFIHPIENYPVYQFWKIVFDKLSNYIIEGDISNNFIQKQSTFKLIIALLNKGMTIFLFYPFLEFIKRSLKIKKIIKFLLELLLKLNNISNFKIEVLLAIQKYLSCK